MRPDICCQQRQRSAYVCSCSKAARYRSTLMRWRTSSAKMAGFFKSVTPRLTPTSDSCADTWSR